MRDRMLALLKEVEGLYGEEATPVHHKMIACGQDGLRGLQELSLDPDLDINVRKSAIVAISKFDGDAPGDFIAEHFVNGRIPAQMYEDYTSGKDQKSLPLFREAAECLRGLGFDI